jgi:hypothetical protein
MVERVPALEGRFGLAIDALYAVYSESQGRLTVNFDLLSESGFIEQNLRIVISAYNELGQLVTTTDDIIFAEEFVGIDSVSNVLACRPSPSMLRVYPKPA